MKNRRRTARYERPNIPRVVPRHRFVVQIPSANRSAFRAARPHRQAAQVVATYRAGAVVIDLSRQISSAAPRPEGLALQGIVGIARTPGHKLFTTETRQDTEKNSYRGLISFFSVLSVSPW